MNRTAQLLACSGALLALLITTAAAGADFGTSLGTARPETPASAAGRPSPLEPLREAQRRFNLAVALYEDGDLRGALAEFRRAHDVFPSYKVLYNLALVSRELHDWAGALRHYRDYLDGGGIKIPAERRLQVERDMVELAERVGRLDVELVGGTAAVLVDDQAVTLVRGETLLVNPGKRRIRVTFPGRPAQLRTVEIASGDRAKVSFTAPAPARAPQKRAQASAPASTLAAAPAAPPPAASTSSGAAWAWAATGLLGAGALACGLMARQSHERLRRERERFPPSPPELARYQNRTRGYSVAADAALVSTAILAAVSIYLSVSGPETSERRASAGGLRWSF